MLEYSAPSHLSRPGDLGSPGTTRHHGRGCQGCLLAVLLLVVLAFVAVVVTVLALPAEHGKIDQAGARPTAAG